MNQHKRCERQVFYRKWRPQTLGEVVGQEHVTQTLRNALKQNHLAHAYLFCGPRGTGKTTTGRILAKTVNCLDNEGRGGEPCNKCEMCAAITQGRAMDVIEIDAASNRKIDEMRDLRERVKFAPNSARYKVYIIDEVHMLTEQAANALLKTLEEPPPYVIFVLATTEPHKLLPTILSRCQRFDFRRLPITAITTKLNHICEEENVSIDSTALNLIAKAACGSLRDAENLLEQAVIHYDYQVNEHQVQEFLGITTDFRVRELALHVINKDITAGLTTINSIVSDGLGLSQFHQMLVEYLRNMLLIKSGAEDTTNLTQEEREELREVSGRIPLGEILRAVKTFAQIDLRSDEYSPLPLELAMVEYSLPASISITKSRDASTPVQGIEKTDIPPAEVLQKREERVAPVEREEEQGVEESLTPHPQKTEGESFLSPQTPLEHVRAQWGDFVNTLRGMGSNRNLDAFLRSACEPVDVQGDTLVLRFRHSFHRDKIANPKYRHLVEKKLAEKFTTPNKIECVLESQVLQKTEVLPRKVTEGHLVKAALEMGAQIISVEEK